MTIHLFGRLSLRGALACAATMGCLSTAHAQVLSVPVKFTYKGSVVARAYPSQGTCTSAYTVPSGVSFRITDLLLDSYGSTAAIPFQYLCSGTSSCATPLSAYITAPASGTMVVNYQTGPRLDAGTTLYVCNYSGSHTSSWTINGYTYTNP